MNTVGRQRSGASTAHHQPQYSDHFLDASSNGRWLQSAGVQHLQSSNTSIPPLQVYGGGGQGSRMYRIALRGFNGGSEFSTPWTPPVNSWPSGRGRNGEEPESLSGACPGLLDLHSIDTELLPEVSVPGRDDAPSLYRSAEGRSFDDSEPYIGNNKQTGRVRAVPETAF